jgi:hypothetical protein
MTITPTDAAWMLATIAIIAMLGWMFDTNADYPEDDEADRKETPEDIVRRFHP